MKNLLPGDGELYYFPKFLNDLEATFYFDALAKIVPWEQKQMLIYDKMVQLPRLTAWFGPAGQNYLYSGVLNQTQPWIPELIEIKNQLEKFLNEKFNSCLLNFYREGKDYVSWHSDNEKELGVNPIIASLSLGVTRSFQIKHKMVKLETLKIDVANGDLVLMKGNMQKNWLHRIAPTVKEVGPRINLTFRTVF